MVMKVFTGSRHSTMKKVFPRNHVGLCYSHILHIINFGISVWAVLWVKLIRPREDSFKHVIAINWNTCLSSYFSISNSYCKPYLQCARQDRQFFGKSRDVLVTRFRRTASCTLSTAVLRRRTEWTAKHSEWWRPICKTPAGTRNGNLRTLPLGGYLPIWFEVLKTQQV